MDEDISIINSNTRNEKIKKFLINNKKILITSLIFLIILIISFFGYKELKKEKIKEISDFYNSTIIEYLNVPKKKTVNSLIEIINEKNSTYSPLSLYFLIDEDLVSSRKEMNVLFDVLINKTTLDKEIKYLVIYKKALYNADKANEGELLEILKPLLNSKSIWTSHGLYLIAEFFYSKNEKQKSKDFFNKILELKNANQDIILETKKRISRDFSD